MNFKVHKFRKQCIHSDYTIKWSAMLFEQIIHIKIAFQLLKLSIVTRENCFLIRQMIAQAETEYHYKFFFSIPLQTMTFA